MAGVRFPALESRPMAFLDFTSVTLDEFQPLVPPFETAFHARMAGGDMGRRASRRSPEFSTVARPVTLPLREPVAERHSIVPTHIDSR